MSDMEPSDGEEGDERTGAGGTYESWADGLASGAEDDGFEEDEDEDEDEEPPASKPLGRGGASDDDDDDDDDDDVQEPDDDDDDDGDDDADDDERGGKGFQQPPILQYYGASGAAASSSTSAPKGSASTKKGRPAAPARPKGGGKALAAAAATATWAGGGGDDSEADEQPVREAPVKKRLTLAAVDPVEEHDQLRRAHANGAAQEPRAEERDASATVEVPPKVNRAILNTLFLVKNDKGPVARRWYGLTAHEQAPLPATTVVHAPNYKGAAHCVMAMSVERVLASRKEREAMQQEWVSHCMTDVIGELQIYKVPVDPNGNCSGPGIVNVAAFLPCAVKDTEEAVDALRAKLPSDVRDVVFLLPVDEKLVKRMYKVGRGLLPRAYDPNAHGNVKYRVWGKLEDQEKIDGSLEWLASPATSAKSKRKRSAENGASKKAATAAATAAAAATTAAPPPPPPAVANDDNDDDDDENGIVADRSGPCFTRIKWTQVPTLGIEMAGIKCDANQTVHVTPAGNGRYILVKTHAP